MGIVFVAANPVPGQRVFEQLFSPLCGKELAAS